MSAITATVSAALKIERSARERLAPGRHPFLNADFFSILDEHETAVPACHVTARDDDNTVPAIAPSDLRSNSHGAFIRDRAWANAYRQLGKRYYPTRRNGLPHFPAKRPRRPAGCESLRSRLIEACKAVVEVNERSSWHVAMPADDEIPLFQAHGLLVSHNVLFQWQDRGHGNFDAFLVSFASERRRKVKAERRKLRESGLSIEIRQGDEIGPAQWPALHAPYASSFKKFGNHATFSPECFADLAASLGGRMVLFIACADDAPVAISICFRSDTTLYGRYRGCNGNYHGLHFELCFYQGIAYCLRQGLATFEPGAGGEHKLARGIVPTIVRFCHWIADKRMRPLIGQHLVRQEPAVQAYAAEAAGHLPFKAEAAQPTSPPEP